MVFQMPKTKIEKLLRLIRDMTERQSKSIINFEGNPITIVFFIV